MNARRDWLPLVVIGVLYLAATPLANAAAFIYECVR